MKVKRFLVCVHCGKPYKETLKRTRLEEEPCDKCLAIVARKRLACSIRRERKWKKYWSRYGRETLKEEVETKEHLFTRIRYVSQEELNRIAQEMSRVEKRPVEYYKDVVWNVIEVGYGWADNVNGTIGEPGYYRVEPELKEPMSEWATQRTPVFTAEWSDDPRRLMAGWSRIDETETRVGYRIRDINSRGETKKETKKIKAMVAIALHRQWITDLDKKASKKNAGLSRRFFTTLAMAGAFNKAS